ncbi:MAG: hypothetical protein JW966_05900 [Anaerolineae bacterium]|nr:hypothetical protein [Anaerolineae bacterium]
MNSTPAQAAGEQIIKVDVESFGVRFLVPVLSISLTLVFHVLMQRVAGPWLNDHGIGATCVILPLDIALFMSSAYIIERLLKSRIPIRRFVTLNDAALTLTDARHTPPATIHINWDQTINVKAWRFVIRRRTRIPKGWLCLALQLLQDERDMIIYAFMSAEDAEVIPGYHNFIRLRPRKETTSNTDLNAAAEQRRLLKLENARWEDGAEVAPDDFKAILSSIKRHVPGWA